MDFCNTRDENANFSAPSNWDPEQDGICGTLPVRVETSGRYLEYTSTWQPNALERQQLLDGAVIEVHLIGTQCPMSVSVVDPVGVVRVDSHDHERKQRAVVINEDAHGHG